MKYNTLIAAGTFDNFHKGHEAYITHAFSIANRVFLTVTSDAYTTIHKPSAAPFTKRVEEIKKFLHEKDKDTKVIIVPIDDVFGITLNPELDINAILVTEKTYEGAIVVNKKRKEKGLSPLQIVTMPVVDAQNKMPISSSQIRLGTIDRSGTLFIDPKWTTQTHVLPQELRQRFHQPFGQLVQKIPDVPDEKTITVGDITTKRFLDAGKKPIIAIIDFFVERKLMFSSITELGFSPSERVITITNPSGEITKEVWSGFQDALEAVAKGQSCIVRITGEEDLSVLPLILSLPLGFHIFYGQPKEGLIWVEVTESLKKEVYQLLKRFL